MSNYFIGDFIRDTRLRRGYTQEELSFGICTAASLSRIENGVQTPGKHILDGLLERLGIEDKVFDTFMSKEEMEVYEEIQELTRNLTDCNFMQLEKQIQKLSGMIKDTDILHRQYLMFATGVVQKVKGEALEHVMKTFMEAIHMTLPDFDGKHPLEANLLTFHEITIINNIAIIHMHQGNIEDALTLEYWLKLYMEGKLIDGREKIIKYPMILYNLSTWLGRLERYEDALELANEGIDYCIRYGNLVAFPLLIFNKGCALAELGKQEQAITFFRQSAVLFEATKQADRRKQTVDWCEKKYHMKIEP